jgi:hypothetical protein
MCNVWKDVRQPFPALKTRPDVSARSFRSAKRDAPVSRRCHVWLPSSRAFGANYEPPNCS